MIFLVILGLVLLFGFAAFTGAPYVPSKKSDLRKAFSELYPLGKDDLLVDIGSGDGIVLRMAAAEGARAVGYEINPLLVWISRFLSRSSKGVTIHLASFWKATLPKDTTVVYVFGDSRDIEKMRDKVQASATESGQSIALISYAFKVPGMTPQKKVGAHYLYRVEPLQKERA